MKLGRMRKKSNQIATIAMMKKLPFFFWWSGSLFLFSNCNIVCESSSIDAVSRIDSNDFDTPPSSSSHDDQQHQQQQHHHQQEQLESLVDTSSSTKEVQHHQDRHYAHANALVHQWELKRTTQKDEDNEEDPWSLYFLPMTHHGDNLYYYDFTSYGGQRPTKRRFSPKLSLFLNQNKNDSNKSTGRLDFLTKIFFHYFGHSRKETTEKILPTNMRKQEPKIHHRRTTDINNNSDKNTTKTTTTTTTNSHIHGWTPERFPNPIHQPKFCHIEPFAQKQKQSQQNDHLLLCDPDSILDYDSREKIAISLMNFTNHFGKQKHCSSDSRYHMKNKKDDDDDDRLIHNHNLIHKRTLQQRDKVNTNKKIEINNDHEEMNQKPHSKQSQTTKGFAPLFAKKRMVKEVVDGKRNGHDGVVGGTFDDASSDSYDLLPPVEIAVAITRKMNLAEILRTDAYYSYEDQDDMVNDAAQYFARYVHKSWWSSSRHHSQTATFKSGLELGLDSIGIETPSSGSSSNRDDGKTTAGHDSKDDIKGGHGESKCDQMVSGILIFLSIQDRVCFISAGPAVSPVLPWWRLERVVSDMKPDLHRGLYGEAILGAIVDMAIMIQAGSPTMSERLIDFISRFGIVLAFAFFTFVFAAWGEFRDRRNRWQYAESRSQMNNSEKEKARQLQRDYNINECPICLEPFKPGNMVTSLTEDHNDREHPDQDSSSAAFDDQVAGDLKRIDSYCIPTVGSDGLPLKILRCGHVFDQTCWKCWVSSGQGNPCICPGKELSKFCCSGKQFFLESIYLKPSFHFIVIIKVCRQDVAGPKKPCLRSRRRLSNTTTIRDQNSTSPVHLEDQVDSNNIETDTTPLTSDSRGASRSNYDTLSTPRGEDVIVFVDVEPYLLRESSSLHTYNSNTNQY